MSFPLFNLDMSCQFLFCFCYCLRGSEEDLSKPLHELDVTGNIEITEHSVKLSYSAKVCNYYSASALIQQVA